MDVIQVNTASRPSAVYCGASAFEKLKEESGALFVLTDSNVYKLYKEHLAAACPGAPVCVVPAEKSKAQNCHCGVAERSRPMKLKFIWTEHRSKPSACRPIPGNAVWRYSGVIVYPKDNTT